MITLDSLEAFIELTEGTELECKLAGGRDGNGSLPIDFWSTYSAMANTHGGMVLLGVRERKGVFSPVGINDIERIKKDLFSTLGNPTKVSINLLDEKNVKVKDIDGKKIICIEIPQATRKQRPVYLNNNPLSETYIRLHEGDRHCPKDMIKIMLAEQVTDTLDDKIFEGYTIDDLDKESLHTYRKLLSLAKPNHVWLEHNDQELLQCLKAWRKDRKTGVSGLTLAGLLMFGKWTSIQEAMPNYFLDYQEQTENERWDDRIIPDGSWSGNLLDFYRKVYRKLTEDLKVPFKVSDGIRQNDTVIHVALREALVNTLVHADYNGHSPIKIVKKKGGFSFRNPGIMRVPFEIAKVGGESDCRNKIIHQLFLMIGLGERAGSGLPKIYNGWRSQHWSEPKLIENYETNNTSLDLSMENLIPENVLSEIESITGDKFSSLTELEVIILSLAKKEDVINHEKIAGVTASSSRDITLALYKLVRGGFLNSAGNQKGKVYHLANYTPPSPENKIGYEILIKSFIHPPKIEPSDDIALEDVSFDVKLTKSDLYKFHQEQNLFKKYYEDEKIETENKIAEINTELTLISSKLNQNKSNKNSKLDSNGTVGSSLEFELNHKLGDELSHKLKDEVSHKLKDEVSHKLRGEVSHKLRGEVSHKLEDEVSHKLDDEVSHKLGDEVNHKPRSGEAEKLEVSNKKNDRSNAIDFEEFDDAFYNLQVDKLRRDLHESQESLAKLNETYAHFIKPDGEFMTMYELLVGKKFTYELEDPETLIQNESEIRSFFKELKWLELMDMAAPIRNGKKRGIPKSRIMNFIILLSYNGFLSVNDFSELLGRKPAPLRRDFLNPLVKDGLLRLAYPATPTHALQGYRAVITSRNINLDKYDL